MDRSATFFEERIGLERDEELVDQGNEEAEEEKVELEMAETGERGKGEGMVGLGGVVARGFHVVAGAAHQVAQSKGQHCGGGEEVIDQGSHCATTLISRNE